MRRLLLAAVALLLVVGAGLGVWWATRETDGPVVLKVAAGPRGSDGYTLMREVAAVVARSSSAIQLRIYGTPSSSRNVRLLKDGEMDLGTIEASSPPIEGLGFVADLFPDHYLLIAREETPVRTVYDLPGSRLAVPESGTIEQRNFWAIADHYSIGASTITFLPMTKAEATEQLLEGKADVGFFLSSIRDPTILAFIEQANIRGVKLRFVEVDQAAAMALKRPFLTPATIVRGAFGGSPVLPQRDTRTAAVHRILAASADAPPAAIAELTRVLFENRLDLLIRMPLSAAITGPIEGGIALPLHEGARRFYDRDKPSFLQENAEPMAFIVTLITILLSLLLALRRAFMSRQKNRADDHNQTLLALSRRARTADTLTELTDVRAELFDLMERVVTALDEDKVTEDGFRSFATIWETVRTVVRDRRNELQHPSPSGLPVPTSSANA